MAKPVMVQQVDVTGADGVEHTVLAQSIVKLSKSADQMMQSGLKRRTLLVLLRDQTGLSLSDIDKVIEAFPKLAKIYTTR